MKERFILTFLSILSLHMTKAREPQGFPIIADIIHTELYDAKRFRDIHKAGFNVCMCRCKSKEKIDMTLYHASTHGMKVILYNNLIIDNPERIIPLIKDNEALWQYHLADEPKMKQWDSLSKLQKRIKKLDPQAKCYINLLPNISKELLKSIGVNTYPEYLKEYSKIEQPQISYDFYPVREKGVKNNIWYSILEDIRNESLRTGKPFWAYILCVPHAIYPMPTIGHLRLQCYVNLAYGAQGIQYFSYATPEPNGINDFHDGPMLRDGKKGRTYKLVKKMNTELKPVANLFWQCKVTGIKHRKCIDGEVLESHFTKGGKRYTCFVNKSADKNVTVSLRPTDYACRIRKDMKTEDVSSCYTLSAGDILILKMKSEEATPDGRRESQ